MAASQQKKPDEIAQRARALGPRERQSFVEQQCGADATLISQVLALLDQSDSAARYWQANHAAEEWTPASLIGARLGPYELKRLIGSGGMGEVYLAERIDHEFEQKVAIKLVRGSLLSDDIRARLRTERQILASLQHPNIATLLDGGTAPDGTPYLVMEYIEGVPIDVYCDRQQLSIEQRLQLFCKVCAAVQCAHQSLIVHRDLKPNNILVTADGEPKLLDFGIAKLLDTQLNPHTVTVTHHQFRVMTPAHASPEQVRGEPITTASDIYVLGVLLYELLSGKRPFVLPYHCRLADVERLVCHSTPLSPSATVLRSAAATPGLMHDLAYSRNTSVSKLARRLRGDLDNIVMMALRKEPARRYASAAQFAEDIQHWLQDQPVIASKDSWLYRSRKFVYRHTLAVMSALAIVILLAGFSVVTYLQSQNIARQRDAAAAERNRAEQVSSFLVELFELSDPSQSRGNELKARELLDVGARRIDSDLQSQPATRAMLLNTIGKVYGSLGLYKEAADSLEKSLQTREQLYGGRHDEVAASLMALGEAHLSQGKLDLAEADLKRALAMQQQLHGKQAVEQAPVLRLMGRLALERGQFAAAEQTMRAAMTLYDSHGMQDSLGKAAVLSDLGKILADQYHEAAAEPLYRAALKIETAALGEDHPRVAELKNRLADALEGQGKYTEAASLFREAVDTKRRVLGNEHPQTIDALENYGNFLRRKGDYPQAEAVLIEALQANRKLYGEQHSYVGYDHVNLGLLGYDRGDYARADSEFSAALSIYAHSLEPDNVLIAGAKIGLGRTLTRLGKPQQAMPLLEEAIVIASNALGDDNPVTDTARGALGLALLETGNTQRAKELLQNAQPGIEQTYGQQAVITHEVRAGLQRIQRIGQRKGD
ncbi:MAG: tetratricopeptide repeat protein [Steroidobacteraceae bacterium]